MKYKTTDLFGNETIQIAKGRKKDKTLFDDYDGFVDKFKHKLTTDDCYTPPKVYDCVVNYVAGKFDLAGRQIIRPFYPNMDYQLPDYPEGCIVIDNPPFSKLAEIARFYAERGIYFFLFAPHLTLFSFDIDLTAVVADATIEYENGATVKTSFLSNIFGDMRIIGAPDLQKALHKIQKLKTANLPKYKYPQNLLTVSSLAWYVRREISIQISKNDVVHISQLDSQKPHKKTLFGAGFLVSDKVVELIQQAKAEADESEDDCIEWQLSPREKQIIEKLNKVITEQ